jgi:hypothetical protein
MESIVNDMESIAKQSQDYYEGQKIGTEELLRVSPTAASIAQSVEWIPYISNIYRRELLEKKNILERVNYNNSDGIEFLYGQWTCPIHIDRNISTNIFSSIPNLEYFTNCSGLQFLTT